MSWWSLKEKRKRWIVDISVLCSIIEKGDIFLYSFKIMSEPQKYIFYLYDYDLKYICECQGMNSYDIRMLRKVFPYLYSYDDEVNEIAKIFGVPK